MKKLFKILICAIIVDFFYYSSVFTFTRGVNTKLILGVIGLATFLIKSARAGTMKFSKQMIVLTILAFGVTLASLLAMVYNSTEDNAYATYLISMLVWLSAAYMVIVTLDFSFGTVTIELVADFIIAISVFQCTIAILGDLFVPVNNFIKMLVPGTSWLDSVERMYGIGDTTALDTGGIRYSIACVLCAYMLTKTETRDKDALIPWYLFAYMFITVIGNMIARTTTVGAVIALLYLLLYSFSSIKVSISKIKLFGWFLAIFLFIVIIASFLYDTNETFHQNIRFGFEGFFNLIETGEWKTNSNNTLKAMYVFPDNPKTWIVGDGYFNNPSSDPNYLGNYTQGYYMNTDVGYLRFIFYFGIIGLFIFSAMILYAGGMCRQRFPDSKFLFLILTLINFIIWFKVSTDCFFILGLFIALAYVRDYHSANRDSLQTQ